MRRLLIGILTFLSTFPMLAQNKEVELGSKVEVSHPKLLMGRVYASDIQDIENNEDFNLGDGYWTVISDRSNNKTYSEPNSNASAYKTLGFNDIVKIAKVSNGYALVFKDVDDAQFPYITKKAEALGWIPLKNLLLWNRCPMTDNSIYKKALIVFDPYDESQVNALASGQRNLVRYNPDSDSETVSAEDKIYFVMKEITNQEGEKLVLLSEVSRLEGLTSHGLVGWIDSSKIYNWNNRVCLEPEWMPRVKEHWMKESNDSTFTVEVYHAPREFALPFLKESITLEEPRTKGNVMRLPIVETHENPDFYKIIVYGSIREDKLMDNTGENSQLEPFGRLNKDFIINFIGNKAYYNLKENDSSLFVTGFINKNDIERRNVWVPIIFISERELYSLLGDLRKIYQSSAPLKCNRSERINAYIQAVKSILPAELNSEEQEKIVRGMTLGEIKARFAGADIPYEATGSEYTLSDLMDPNIVSEEDYNYILYEFSKKYEKLQDILKKADCILNIGDEIYYWIPFYTIP